MQKYGNSMPPLAGGALPVLGHIPLAIKSRFELISQAQTAGRVCRLKFGPKTVYFLNDYRDLQRVLVSDANAFKRGVHFEKMRNMVGDGVVTTSGELHRKQRSMLMPTFSKRRLDAHIYALKELCVEFGQSIESKGVFEPMGPLMAFGSKLVCVNLFGEDCPPSLTRLIQQAVPVFVRNAAIQAVDITGVYKHLPTNSNRAFKKYLSELDEFLYEIIRRRRTHGDAGAGIVGELIRSKPGNSGFSLSDKEIRDQIATILLASTETTANTVSWTLFELYRNQAILARVREELSTVCSDFNSTSDWLEVVIGRDDLPLLKNVIQESLRLYPSSYLLSREAVQDIELGGFEIPKDSEILYSHYAQQRDPANFCDPDTFNPDRWDEDFDGVHVKPAFMPFGHGAYRCLGDNLALMEATYLIAYLVGRYEVEVVEPEKVSKLGNITLSPKNLYVRFSSYA